MITIDEKNGTVELHHEDGRVEKHSLSTARGFEIVSRAWLRAGWDAKYVYSFTWLGRPIIQLPEDLLRLQEVIYSVRPDVIVETGVAHGGGLIFYASLCKAMGRGRVIGIDREIRAHNRAAIEAHFLAPLITLVEGDSVAPRVLDEVRSKIKPSENVLVLLDSCHTKEHVLAELNAYAPLVSAGSYLVAMDGIMGDLEGAPRTAPDWSWNNPREAALEFARCRKDFVLIEPKFLFNEGSVQERVSYWPGAFLQRTA